MKSIRSRYITSLPKKKIVVLDPIHESFFCSFDDSYEIIKCTNTCLSSVFPQLQLAEVIVIRSGATLDRDVLEHCIKLKLICRAGVGVDNIDISVAKERGITVFNVPSTSCNAVSELAFGLLLALARNIALADRQIRSGLWNKSALIGYELRNKTVGVLGLGEIGFRVYELADAFGMNVIYHSRTRKNRSSPHLVSFQDLLKNSDFLVVCVPLTSETINLISERELNMMKQTAFLINVSRGGVVSELDLLLALESKTIAGAASDVFDNEKETTGLSLLPNFVSTPHIGAMTVESQIKIAAISSDNIKSFYSGNPIANQLC